MIIKLLERTERHLLACLLANHTQWLFSIVDSMVGERGQKARVRGVQTGWQEAEMRQT